MAVDLESVCTKCYDFCAERVGDSFRRTFSFEESNTTPIDFTGYTGTSEIRDYETNALLTSFAVTPAPLDATGTISLALTVAQTTALGEGVYTYDIQIDDGAGTVRTMVMGSITFCEDVTD